MADKHRNSDWLDTLQCLAHVAILFGPVAVGLAIVAVYSSKSGEAPALVDQVVTGAVDQQ